MIECAGLPEAIAAASELARANSGGAYEIRPVAMLRTHKVFE
jgi:hypothetical protein